MKQEIENLGYKIRDERKARGLTQSQLATLAHVSLNFVSQLESGKPTVRLDKILVVMKILGLEIKIQHARGITNN